MNNEKKRCITELSELMAEYLNEQNLSTPEMLNVFSCACVTLLMNFVDFDKTVVKNLLMNIHNNIEDGYEEEEIKYR